MVAVDLSMAYQVRLVSMAREKACLEYVPAEPWNDSHEMLLINPS